MQEQLAVSVVLGALLVIAMAAVGMLWRAYRRSDDAHRRLVERIETLKGSPDHALAQHADQLQALGRVLAGVAHDLNSTLSVVVMNLDVMQQDPALTDRHSRRIENMIKATQKGTNLTRHLLSLSHRHKPQKDVVCLAECLPSLVELLQTALGKNVEIETMVAEDLWNTHLDVSAFETAAVHLALATAGATPMVDRLAIELKNLILDNVGQSRREGVDTGEHVLLVMASSGPSAAPESGKQASPTDDLFGPGPGLLAVERFAMHSGGHLRIERDGGCGMRAVLYLPRCCETTEV
jgi:signal transduction histidine kinase